MTATSGTQPCTRKRLGSMAAGSNPVLLAISSSRPAVQVMTWLGSILAARRRQNEAPVSPARADQVSTKPLSMKKNPTAASARLAVRPTSRQLPVCLRATVPTPAGSLPTASPAPTPRPLRLATRAPLGPPAPAVPSGGPARPTSTLVSQARRLAETIGDRPSYTFIDYLSGPQGRRDSLTWYEVDARARALAAALRSRVIAGERAAVLVPQSLDFVVAMLGAFYARVVAIPLFTPDLPGHRGRLLHILADADPACVLTTEAAAASVEALLHESPARPRHTLIVDTVPAALAGGWRDEEIRPADLAYLQYTSGSTRAPAGVMIIQGCLTAK